MIKPHQFISLAAATAVSVVLALGLYVSTNRWSAGKVEGAALLPDLQANLASVTAIEVTEGGQTLTIEGAGAAWKVRERGGFPVKPEAVRKLLYALAEAKLVEPRTATKVKLALLELEDPTTKDAKSRRVRLLGAGGKPLSDVMIGKTRFDAFGSGKGGIYVRRFDETQSWLATGDPKVTANIKDWIETKVFGADADKAVKVTIHSPGEEPLVVEKAPPAAAAEATPNVPPKAPGPPAKVSKFRLAIVPEGKKLKDGANIDQIVDGFASIDLDDVRKLDATPADDKVTVVKLEREASPTVTFRLRKDGDTSWLSLSATGDGDTKKAADELNAKAQGWEFKIPTWKAEQIGKRRADLFETS